MKTTGNRKTLFLSLAVAGIFIACATALGLLLAPDADGAVAVFSVTDSEKEGHISPLVKDGDTGEPVAGAVIVLPESGQQFTTDSSGKIGEVAVPIARDTRYDALVAQPWGEATLLVYKDGYAPYALFDYMILPGETREGPEIYLFKSSDSTPYSLVEGPNRTWVEALLDHYKPESVK